MYVSGSAQPQITITDLYIAGFTLPDKKTTDCFSDIVRTWESKIINNQRQTRTLEKLRDTLLPKLMSGEVRVKI
jgi:type I restriction enzyme S subunit